MTVHNRVELVKINIHVALFCDRSSFCNAGLLITCTKDVCVTMIIIVGIKDDYYGIEELILWKSW